MSCRALRFFPPPKTNNTLDSQDSSKSKADDTVGEHNSSSSLFDNANYCGDNYREPADRAKPTKPIRKPNKSRVVCSDNKAKTFRNKQEGVLTRRHDTGTSDKVKVATALRNYTQNRRLPSTQGSLMRKDQNIASRLDKEEVESRSTHAGNKEEDLSKRGGGGEGVYDFRASPTLNAVECPEKKCHPDANAIALPTRTKRALEKIILKGHGEFIALLERRSKLRKKMTSHGLSFEDSVSMPWADHGKGGGCCQPDSWDISHWTFPSSLSDADSSSPPHGVTHCDAPQTKVRTFNSSDAREMLRVTRQNRKLMCLENAVVTNIGNIQATRSIASCREKNRADTEQSPYVPTFLSLISEGEE